MSFEVQIDSICTSNGAETSSVSDRLTGEAAAKETDACTTICTAPKMRFKGTKTAVCLCLILLSAAICGATPNARCGTLHGADSVWALNVMRHELLCRLSGEIYRIVSSDNTRYILTNRSLDTPLLCICWIILAVCAHPRRVGVAAGGGSGWRQILTKPLVAPTTWDLLDPGLPETDSAAAGAGGANVAWQQPQNSPEAHATQPDEPLDVCSDAPPGTCSVLPGGETTPAATGSATPEAPSTAPVGAAAAAGARDGVLQGRKWAHEDAEAAQAAAPHQSGAPKDVAEGSAVPAHVSVASLQVSHVPELSPELAAFLDALLPPQPPVRLPGSVEEFLEDRLEQAKAAFARCVDLSKGRPLLFSK